eukprot:6679844-Prymnesium_polylepis.1
MGNNIQDGDRAKWVPATATSCDTSSLSPDRIASGTVGETGETINTFAVVGLYSLCYKWNYRQQHVNHQLSPTPY